LNFVEFVLLWCSPGLAVSAFLGDFVAVTVVLVLVELVDVLVGMEDLVALPAGIVFFGTDVVLLEVAAFGTLVALLLVEGFGDDEELSFGVEDEFDDRLSFGAEVEVDESSTVFNASADTP
jgi:hypothetical protein